MHFSTITFKSLKFQTNLFLFINCISSITNFIANMVIQFRCLYMNQAICHNVQRWRPDTCSDGGCFRLYFIRDVGLRFICCWVLSWVCAWCWVGCGVGFLTGLGIRSLINVLNCRVLIVAGAGVVLEQQE